MTKIPKDIRFLEGVDDDGDMVLWLHHGDLKPYVERLQKQVAEKDKEIEKKNIHINDLVKVGAEDRKELRNRIKQGDLNWRRPILKALNMDESFGWDDAVRNIKREREKKDKYIEWLKSMLLETRVEAIRAMHGGCSPEMYEALKDMFEKELRESDCGM